MKQFFAVLALLAVASAAPGFYHGYPVAVPLVYSSQHHSQDTLGQYSYGYADHLSSKAEARSFDGVTHGGYSYVDAEGKVQSVSYTADDVHGFRVAATNLPKAPEVPKVPEVEAPKPVEDTPEVAAAKVQHQEAVKEAEARSAAAPEEVPEFVAPVVSAYHAPVLAYAQGFHYATANPHVPNPYYAPYVYHY